MILLQVQLDLEVCVSFLQPYLEYSQIIKPQQVLMLEDKLEDVFKGDKKNKC